MDILEDVSNSEIRQKLSGMTFEELQSLKAKLGSKVYNEAVFGTTKETKKEFKRENKNRPRELSSKRPEQMIFPKKQMIERRDPRFEPTSGEFNEVKFRKQYSFLDEIRQREKSELIRELKKEEDPDERRKIKMVLRRLNNREREDKKKQEKEKKREEELEKRVKDLKEGKKPYFRTKLEKKVVNLVEQYSELKKTGKLNKHIEKQWKRKKQLDRKRGVFDD